jgi:Fe-S-cluster containining protein
LRSSKSAMEPEYAKWLQKAEQQQKATKQFLKKLRKKPPKDLDQRFQHAHKEAFEQVDCLGCANCCKTMSPRVCDRDIRRIARVLGMTERRFTETYLYCDEDGEYLMNAAPCPFLGDDNKCLIYEDRPDACANFPHTNHRKMHKHLNTAAHNYDRCPIVYTVLEQLKQELT